MRTQCFSLGLASAFLLNASAFTANAADSVLGPVIQGVATVASSSAIANMFGSSRISMTPKRYDYVVQASYGTLKNDQAYSIFVDVSGTVRYTRRWSVTPAGDGNSGTSTAPFDFGPASRSNPTTGIWIPYEIRKYLCALPFGDSIYTYAINSKLQWEVAHTYAVNPIYMSPYTAININLVGWSPKLRDCSNLDSDTSFLRQFRRYVANNGFTLVVVPDGETVNREFDASSGIGVTF